MKPSERRLLIIFVVLAAVMGAALLSQQLLKWDHQLDRMERDLELAGMESDALITQAPYWKASSEWIQRTQPVAASGYDAGNNLLETLRHAAMGAGFDIKNTQLDQVVPTAHYRQVGVTLTVKGDLAKILEWIYVTLDPSAFYVVPRLKISPDKGESQDVVATVTFQRRYTPEFASVPAAAAPSPSPSSSPSPTVTPAPPLEVGKP